MNKILPGIFLIMLFCKCSNYQTISGSKKLYTHEHSNRIITGEINASQDSFIRAYLQNYVQGTIQDTIVIRYDFNHETCWDFLDMQSDKYVITVLTNHRKMVRNYKINHPATTLVEFRQPGKQLNKLIAWNDDIFVDTLSRVFYRLVKEQATCGVTMMVLPSRRFIMIRSDSHFEILFMKKEEMEAILAKNNH